MASSDTCIINFFFLPFFSFGTKKNGHSFLLFIYWRIRIRMTSIDGAILSFSYCTTTTTTDSRFLSVSTKRPPNELDRTPSFAQSPSDGRAAVSLFGSVIRFFLLLFTAADSHNSAFAHFLFSFLPCATNYCDFLAHRQNENKLFFFIFLRT